MKILSYIAISTLVFSLFIGCKKEKQEAQPATENTEKDSSRLQRAGHTFGETTFVADPTYKNLVEAWVATYTTDYPDVKIKVDYQIEDLAIKNFYEGLYPIAIVGKELDESQQNYLFNKTTIKYVPSPIAMDATIMVTSTQNPLDSISISQIKQELYKNTNQYIFDRANSSNFNTVNRVLKTKVPEGVKVSSIEDFDEMIAFLEKSPKAIAFIGYNVLSDRDNPKIKAYLTRIKILKIVNEQNQVAEANLSNMRNGSYPFTRLVYILKNEKGFGIGAGFTRFAGSQQGQLIVKKEEMQPYFLYKREVRIQSNAL
ncbi:PstS family phosphate ABC transporter substrate-binding protein [Vaginella massiliensis]|uniref:PstS family phosphate ABC transporter substrate-binding protein n=1 Tax=Vaginella massiliensis TaxID=1816680 RepID=UPI000837F103|nr:substrate-binding domain-containing protein [Vaginella massiliensis]